MLMLLLACSEPAIQEDVLEGKKTSEFSREPQVYAASKMVGPLLDTEWGQAGVWQQQTPLKDGEPTYPGCTTVAVAQILYYYQHQNYALNDVCYSLEHDVSGADIEGEDTLCVNFFSDSILYSWENMALDDAASDEEIETSAKFLYHVGVTLNAQFGGGEGSSATGRQIENALRYQWGYTKRRDGGERSKSVTIVLKNQFFPKDEDFANHIRMELDAGRPVLYMAQQVDADAGHAFVIDGYDPSSDLFHVNWGWGGYANGYYDLSMTDLSGRSWSRNALIYQYLEPVQDAGLEKTEAQEIVIPQYSWNGNGSLISYTSDTLTGYGMTKDEAVIHPDSEHNPVVFFQWEVDTRDGSKLMIKADGQSHATITYGLWNDRGSDVTHRHVPLPFILDPSQDGFPVNDQEYFVLAVRFDQKPSETTTVFAEISDVQGHQGNRVPNTPFVVDNHVWQGNASVISYASQDKTGYGLDRDEGLIRPQELAAPTFYAQWELSEEDGMKMQISGPSQTATIRYGFWDDRSQDVYHRNVSFPFVIDPKADGVNVADGSYLVIAVEGDENPLENEIVELTLQK